MATMIPAGITEFQTQGEERVYRFIEAVAKPDDRFICWYTPDIEDREPDFVIFSRDLGLIVLEVKDWNLEQIQEVTPRDALVVKGSRVEHLPNPLRQARECALAIKDALRADGRLLHREPAMQNKVRLPIEFGVVLANVNKYNFQATELGKVIPVEKTLFWDDLHPQSDICSDPSGQRFRAKFENMFPPRFAFSLSGRELDFLRQVLFPVVRIELPARGGEQFSLEKDRLLALDRNQEAIARKYDSGHSILVGPSGSGKTLVLAHKAALLQRYNPAVKRVLVLCYNITLVSFIRRLLAAKKSPLGPKGIDVMPIFHLCSRILDMSPSDEGESPEFYEMLAEEAADKASESGLLWDAVLIDEGQDFTDAMLKVAVGVLNPATDNLTVALDENQDVYLRQNSWKELGIKAKGRVHHLPCVYRNTTEISDLASAFINLSPSTQSQKDDQHVLSSNLFGYHGPSPELRELRSVEEVGRYIAKTVTGLAAEGCPLSEIAVLYTTRAPKTLPGIHVPSLLARELESEGIISAWISEDARAKKSYDVTTERVAISTIHSVKGLDYACVFLVGLEFLEPGRWTEEQIRRLVYVGITRARYRLFIPFTSSNAVVQRLLECSNLNGGRQ